MRLTSLASLLAVLLVHGLIASPAEACKWDRETNSREAEFKSQYTPAGSPGSPATWFKTPPNSLDYVLLGAGGVLGILGLGIGVGVGAVALRKSA